MGRVVAIGKQDFADIVKNNYFYIDKTEFIREWWESGDVVTLITRPRRFGKTLNMNMVYRFFSNNFSDDIFSDLSIWNHEYFRKYKAMYPVIFLSFASVKGSNIEDAKYQIKSQIVKVFDEFSNILSEADYTDNEVEEYRRVRTDMADAPAYGALNLLSSMLEKRYGNKVIILLDEYDTPLQEAYISGFWDEMVIFIRNLFNATFKTNTSLERALLTGITRVSKESIFSDLNNLEVVSTTSDKYSSSFGFTEEEVFCALDEMGYSNNDKDRVKKWYDGFTFGKCKDIYNPWSITKFLDSGKLGTHWANTSSNGLIDKIIRTGNRHIKIQFESLLRGESIESEIDEQVIYEQLNTRKDAIWSLLLASGYLKVDDVYYPFEQSDDVNQVIKKPVYTLSLTNLEVRAMFSDLIGAWFEKADDYNDFINAMLSGRIDDMNHYMNNIALATFSYFDAGNSPSDDSPERFYHGFVLGLMVDRAVDYVILSNRESGRGRYDVVMKPKVTSDSRHPAIIIEFKVFDKDRGEKDLSDTAEAALKQIEEKKYADSLIREGIKEEHIIKYGFAFKGKEVLIKK